MKEMALWQWTRTAFLLLAVTTLLTGGLYPLIVTGLAQAIFPWRANGSIIQISGGKSGSELIGQSFSEPRYFWGRPSATAPGAYNGASPRARIWVPQTHRSKKPCRRGSPRFKLRIRTTNVPSRWIW